MVQNYISRSYKSALFTLILLFQGFVILWSLKDPLEHKIVTIISSLGLLIGMITALRGIIQFYKGRREKRSYKFMVAIIGNGLGLIFFFIWLIAFIRILQKML